MEESKDIKINGLNLHDNFKLIKEEINGDYITYHYVPNSKEAFKMYSENFLYSLRLTKHKNNESFKG